MPGTNTRLSPSLSLSLPFLSSPPHTPYFKVKVFIKGTLEVHEINMEFLLILNKDYYAREDLDLVRRTSYLNQSGFKMFIFTRLGEQLV